MQRIDSVIATFVVAAVLAISTAVLAHGEGERKGFAAVGQDKSVPDEQMAFGIAGDPAQVTRTLAMEALDSFRYSPDRVDVRRGETVRFVMRNHGKIRHEIVIGTIKDLEEHSALMRRFPQMEHDAPYMLHVAPGESGEIVWQFNRSGTFSFACLIAGHFEAGMVGTVVVS